MMITTTKKSSNSMIVTPESKSVQRIMGIMKVVEALGSHKGGLIHRRQMEGDQRFLTKIHHTNLKKDQVTNSQKIKTVRRMTRRISAIRESTKMRQ
jgi:hypothetical protein